MTGYDNEFFFLPLSVCWIPETSWNSSKFKNNV